VLGWCRFHYIRPVTTDPGLDPGCRLGDGGDLGIGCGPIPLAVQMTVPVPKIAPAATEPSAMVIGTGSHGAEVPNLAALLDPTVFVGREVAAV